ncbi:MAG: LysM repeat protein [Cellvibrionaceae bacterium]|jgi:LysM repeat protein
MEQNNSPQSNVSQSNVSQSNQGTYEWLKFIIFFAAIILITTLVIRVIAPLIFSDYVPSIIGLSEDNNESGAVINSPPTSEEAPLESEPETLESETDEESSESINTENINEDAASASEVEPLSTEESTSSKVEEPENLSVGDIYTVQLGDTLTSIAAANQITIEQLISANNFTNPNQLKAGQKILIPE